MGGKITGAVEGNQVAALHENHLLERLSALSLTEERPVSRAEPIRVDSIETGAHLSIAGDILDMEDGPEIVLLGDSATIKCQQGRILEGHHGETGHEDIVEPDGGLSPAHVPHALEAPVQSGQHRIHTQVFADSRC